MSGCAVALRAGVLAALVACSSDREPLPGITAGGQADAPRSAGGGAEPDDAGERTRTATADGGRSSQPIDPDRPPTSADARVQSATPERSGYCEGEPALPADERACRSHADCGGGTNVCMPTRPLADPCGPCGCMPATITPCDSHDQCESGQCRIAAGTGCPTHYCLPSCRTTGCEPGYDCSAMARCEPVSCEGGFSCGANARCVPGGASADAHGCVLEHCSAPGASACAFNEDCSPGARAPGCVVRECTRDAECDCGSCVNGSCLPHPGVCVTPSAAGGR